MKPVDIESSIGLDRPATWNEVICAMSVSSQGNYALAGACDHFREADSGLSGGACNPPEDIMWLALAGEMPDSKCN